MSDKSKILEMVASQLDGLSDFGQLQLHIKKHVGAFSNTDVVKVQSIKYSNLEPNVTAAGDMLKLFKGTCAVAQQTGRPTSLGFTITIDKDGNAEQMLVQDFKKL